MLREIPETRQIAGEPRRRWFFSQEQDLYVWHDDSGEVIAFQLCYDKHRQEHALYWRADSGFAHLRVDCGSETPLRNGMPLLVADGHFDQNAVAARFLALSPDVPEELRQMILNRLCEYPSPSPLSPG